MSIQGVTEKCWILALFIRDDGERLLLGDGMYDFKRRQQHFDGNNYENDTVDVQGTDGTLLAGQVRRAADQTFEGYIGDATVSKQTIEEYRRDFFMFFRKNYFYTVVYVFPDGTAIQRRRGFISKAPEVKELWQIHPEYSVSLNFEDVNYYSYAENDQGQEIYEKSVDIPLATASKGGLIWGDVEETLITKTGTNFDITNTTTSDTISALQLDGATSQDSTPSPSTPVSVKVVTGEQTISLSNSSESIDYTVNLGNIELCKLGEYQDYIYKEDGNWYLHKETFKEIPTTLANRLSTDTSGKYRFNFNLSQQSVTTSSSIGGVAYSDQLSLDVAAGTYNYTAGKNTFTASATDVVFLAQAATTMTKEEAIAWLVSNPITFYLPLAVATNTQITDATLISQLESILQANLLDGDTSVTVSGDLPSPLTMEFIVHSGGGVVWDEIGATWEEGSGGSNVVAVDSVDNVYPLLTITGLTINPVIENTTTGTILVYDGTIADSQTLKIDMSAQTATLNGTNVIKNISGDWLAFAPGNNTVSYTASNNDAPNATIEWNEVVG